jgi:hypothetical protein
MHIRSAVKWLPWLMLPLAAAAADEGRISFLEQEVRNLQRQVQALTRQVDEMRTRPDRPARAAASPGTDPEEPETDLPRWVDAQRWRQVRRGMSELEVIGSLGAPNSVRDDGDARVLFYAMEIGTARFLAGSVKIRQQAVVEVLAPTLQ